MARSPATSLLPGITIILAGAAIGAGALTYPLGSVFRPGPGFFPLGLAGLLMATGLGVVIEARGADDAPPEPFAWGALAGVVLSILAFGLTVERIGYVPATLLLFAICAVFERFRDWKRLALTAAIISALGAAVFLWGLGLPLAAFGAS